MLRRALESLGFTTAEFPQYDQMDDRIVVALAAIRDRLGVHVRVTSSFRSIDENRRVGGSEHSQHLTGHAIDFVIPEAVPLSTIVDAARIAGVNGFALQYPSRAIHIDVRSTGGWHTWGEIVQAGHKTFNHPLAEVFALFGQSMTTDVYAGDASGGATDDSGAPAAPDVSEAGVLPGSSGKGALWVILAIGAGVLAWLLGSRR